MALHNSTIINAPKIRAESRVYTIVGNGVPRGYLGVRARLFKSGILCEAIDYRYSDTPDVTTFTAGTTADCGSGSYNSHGFVSVFDNTKGYEESITFPSNPLKYTSPAAKTTRTTALAAVSATAGTNARGQTFGSASQDNAIPDLVEVFATNGKTGFVTKQDLNGAAAETPSAAVSQSTAPICATPVMGRSG